MYACMEFIICFTNTKAQSFNQQSAGAVRFPGCQFESSTIRSVFKIKHLYMKQSSLLCHNISEYFITNLYFCVSWINSYFLNCYTMNFRSFSLWFWDPASEPTSIRFIITQAGRLRTDLSFWAFACDEINWSSYRRQKCCLDKICVVL